MEGKGLMEDKIVDGQKSVAGMIFSSLREDSRRPQRIGMVGSIWGRLLRRNGMIEVYIKI